ncbi:MAG: CPBP family intramembrane metalloprotease domain-containing protein, partial [Planctomycetes bacterium]|nr:CPBP family intramembrane metalloprotease domain-containing protein [Planctomycetota bacterium]
MSWKNVKLIFLREIRDQFRDPRSLFMVAVLPLLLYPALGIGFMYMSVLHSEQRQTVVILGAKDLPADPPLLKGSRFVKTFFGIPADADKLDVVTDVSVRKGGKNHDDDKRIELVRQAEIIRKMVEEKQQSRNSARVEQLNGDISRLMAENRLQVL